MVHWGGVSDCEGFDPSAYGLKRAILRRLSYINRGTLRVHRRTLATYELECIYIPYGIHI